MGSRRICLATGSLLVLFAALPTALVAQTLNLTFPAQPPENGNVVQDNFLGISFELSSFDTLWGTTNETIPNAIQNYLHNLNARFDNPMRIRIGGNGMDGSTYVPTMTDKMLELTDPNAYFNDIPVDFGPVLFEVMNAVQATVGPMQFLVGLSMRDPNDTSNTLALATDAVRMLGSSLDGMLLGNEPDLYAGHGERDEYTIDMYIPEIGRVNQELVDAGLLQEPLLGGPTICCSWDLDEVIDAGLDDYNYKYFTLQHYPNNNCGGPSPENTNISYYLSHSNVGEFVGWNERGIALAKQDNVPVLLTEYNSVSCGGSNISDTFATALWAIDAGLKSGAENFSAVYLHTREYQVQYNLFEPREAGNSLDADWRTGSTYYSALFLSEVISRSGSIIVDLDVDNSNTNVRATTAAYGIYDNTNNGEGGDAEWTRGKLVLINYGQGTEGQEFWIPANITSQVRYRTLFAESVYESGASISWAGQSVGLAGALGGNQVIETLNCSETDGCSISVPSPGAVLVLLDEQADFYQGNSTIAPPEFAEGDNSAGRLDGKILTLLLAFVASSAAASLSL